MANINDEEIDFKSIGSKVVGWVMYPFRLLLSNIKTTLFFIMAAIALSFILKYAITRTYKANFVIRPNERNERTHTRMLDDLERLLKLKDYKVLAKELQLSDSIANKLVGLQFTNFAFSKSKADSSNTTLIEIETTDFNHLLTFQNKILDYIENNPYFLKIKEYQKMNIALKSELIDKDIELLDSLKKLQLQSYDKLKITSQNDVFLKDLINPTTTYTLSLERTNQKTGLIAQNMFLDNFQLVKQVVVSEKHAWPPRMLIMCLVLVPLSLLLCVIYLKVKAIQI